MRLCKATAIKSTPERTDRAGEPLGNHQVEFHQTGSKTAGAFTSVVLPPPSKHFAHAGINRWGSTSYQAFTRSMISLTVAESSGWNAPISWNRNVAPFVSTCGSATHA